MEIGVGIHVWWRKNKRKKKHMDKRNEKTREKKRKKYMDKRNEK